MASTTAAKEVACPTCGAKALYAVSNPYRPFCSDRCRDLDLGAWASERYRVPDAADPGEGGGDEALVPPQSGRG
jgi:uncharacterized protein